MFHLGCGSQKSLTAKWTEHTRGSAWSLKLESALLIACHHWRATARSLGNEWYLVPSDCTFVLLCHCGNPEQHNPASKHERVIVNLNCKTHSEKDKTHTNLYIASCLTSRTQNQMQRIQAYLSKQHVCIKRAIYEGYWIVTILSLLLKFLY